MKAYCRNLLRLEELLREEQKAEGIKANPRCSNGGGRKDEKIESTGG